jgi:hypothetical protein
MNGIGNAFIWAAIGSGPVLSTFLGIVALEKRLAARQHAPVRVPDVRRNTVRDRNITDKRAG